MTKAIGALLTLLLCSLVLAADNDSDRESKLLVLEHLWNDAQVHRDPHALQGMIGDHFVDTEYDGEVSDRAKFLADIDNPTFKPSELTIKDVNVMLYRDTAVVVGTYHARGMFSGQPYDHVGRFTDTWVNDGGRWLCVASHSSLIKK